MIKIKKGYAVIEDGKFLRFYMTKDAAEMDRLWKDEKTRIVVEAEVHYEIPIQT